jgi:hypothetical protein
VLKNIQYSIRFVIQPIVPIFPFFSLKRGRHIFPQRNLDNFHRPEGPFNHGDDSWQNKG